MTESLKDITESQSEITESLSEIIESLSEITESHIRDNFKTLACQTLQENENVLS